MGSGEEETRQEGPHTPDRQSKIQNNSGRWEMSSAVTEPLPPHHNDHTNEDDANNQLTVSSTIVSQSCGGGKKWLLYGLISPDLKRCYWFCTVSNINCTKHAAQHCEIKNCNPQQV
jgi:hypothetical protein